MYFLVAGIAKRSGTWSTSEWIRFVLQLALSAGFLVVSDAMARAVDQGRIHDWASAPRLLYVVTMLMIGFYGITSGIFLLATFAGRNAPPRVYYALFFTVVAVTLALGVAMWLDDAVGIPFQQSGAVILGIYSVWIGVGLPEWVRGHFLYRRVSTRIGETATRGVYVAVGVLLIGFGLVGRAHIFR